MALTNAQKQRRARKRQAHEQWVLKTALEGVLLAKTLLQAQALARAVLAPPAPGATP